jgi:hypothetical protein
VPDRPSLVAEHEAAHDDLVLAARALDLARKDGPCGLAGSLAGRQVGGRAARRREREATAAAASAAKAAIQKTSWNASSAGRAIPPTTIVTELRMAPTAALALDVPTDRSRVFRPLAEAVSVIGTARMINVGIAA